LPGDGGAQLQSTATILPAGGHKEGITAIADGSQISWAYAASPLPDAASVRGRLRKAMGLRGRIMPIYELSVTASIPKSSNHV
jgi:hypothetical protein